MNGPLNEEANEEFVANDQEEAADEESKGGDIYEGYETENLDKYEGDSDDEIRRRKYPKCSEKEMNQDYEFQLGAMLTSNTWVSKKILTHISRGDDMKLATVIQTIQDKYMANISVSKAYWARRKARVEVHSRAAMQYSRLWDYCVQIRRTNWVQQRRLWLIGLQ
ncbi:hypothetical protein PIB30_047914 [Stylosanthes scabra]|uniref:Uncharacterized protein n=1 Tax=Stylosanthes scabra TaxID=79078 RepID=A0ABU6THN1_9FABA|nr:hypothetical protein [Stylosanthes scabra]